MDWLDLLAVQGTLKSLLQHHSAKASILRCSAFFRRMQWHPTPVLLPGESHRQRSLAGYSPWGLKEPDTTWPLTLSLSQLYHIDVQHDHHFLITLFLLGGEFSSVQSLSHV